ncbi:fibronectin type III domain-containing protein [Paenibacillus radicis (ex Xue et al. 2023)]
MKLWCCLLFLLAMCFSFSGGVLASSEVIEFSGTSYGTMSSNLLTVSQKVKFNNDVVVSSVDYYNGNITKTSLTMKIYRASDFSLIGTSNTIDINYLESKSFIFSPNAALTANVDYFISITGKGVGMQNTNLPVVYTSTSSSTSVTVDDFTWIIGDTVPIVPDHSSKGYIFPLKIHLGSGQAVPSSPTNLVATGSNQKVDLSWSVVNGATGYNIKRSITAGGPYITVASNAFGTSYNDTNVTNGTKYYYVVTAVNTAGESGNSNEASATPQGTVTPSSSKALLVITLVSGLEKEYDLPMSEVNNFITWYNGRAAGTGSEVYTINKSFNKANFLTRKDYIAFDKIETFEVNEYTPAP